MKWQETENFLFYAMHFFLWRMIVQKSDDE